MRHPRRPRGRPGAAAAEFAALLPFLLLLGVVSADWARLLYFTIGTETCARNGALVLSDQTTWNQTSANPNQATAYPTAYCAAGTPALTTAQQTVLEAAARAEDPTQTPVPTVVASQATDSTGNATVTVTVSRTFTTMVRFPGVPATQTVSRAVTMRVAPQGTK
jgi:Flp pilus assembly protein TadG